MRDSNSIKIHFSHPDGWGEDKTVDEIRTEYGMTLNEYAYFISLESPKTARKMREKRRKAVVNGIAAPIQLPRMLPKEKAQKYVAILKAIKAQLKIRGVVEHRKTNGGYGQSDVHGSGIRDIRAKKHYASTPIQPALSQEERRKKWQPPIRDTSRFSGTSSSRHNASSSYKESSDYMNEYQFWTATERIAPSKDESEGSRWLREGAIEPTTSKPMGRHVLPQRESGPKEPAPKRRGKPNEWTHGEDSRLRDYYFKGQKSGAELVGLMGSRTKDEIDTRIVELGLGSSRSYDGRRRGTKTIIDGLTIWTEEGKQIYHCGSKKANRIKVQLKKFLPKDSYRETRGGIRLTRSLKDIGYSSVQSFTQWCGTL